MAPTRTLLSRISSVEGLKLRLLIGILRVITDQFRSAGSGITAPAHHLADRSNQVPGHQHGLKVERVRDFYQCGKPHIALSLFNTGDLRLRHPQTAAQFAL